MIFRVSATRILSVRACAAKWHFAEIQGLNKSTPAQQLGTDVHSEIESYLRTGMWIEPQPTEDRWKPYKIAQAGMEVLNDLRRRVIDGNGFVETQFRFTDLGPLPFDGAIDFYDPSIPLVLDHKTTSNQKAPWHKTAPELANDLQLNMYLGAVAKLTGRTTGKAKIGHLYYSTKPPFISRSLIVDSTIERGLGALASVSGDMQRMTYYANQPIESVPGNTRECHKYGGCPYITICPHKQGIKDMSKMFGSKRSAVVSADTVLPALIEKCKVVAMATGKPPSIDIVKMLLIDLGSEWDPSVAHGQVLAAISEAPRYDGWSLVFAILILLRRSKAGVLELSYIANRLGVDDHAVLAAVQRGTEQFEDLWTVDGEQLELDVEISDGELAKAAASVDLAELPTVPETSEQPQASPQPRPEKPPTEKVKSADRGALVSRCDVAEKRLPKSELDAIRQKIGVARPRKLSDDRLLEYIEAVESAAKVGSLRAPVEDTAEDLAYALYAELKSAGGAAMPIDKVRATLATLGFTGDDRWFFGVLGAGNDAGYWDHTPSTLTMAKPTVAATAAKPTVAATAAKPTVAATAAKLTVIAIGCASSDAISLEDWLAPVFEAVEAANPGKGPIEGWGFNDGPKAVAAALRLGGVPEPTVVCVSAGNVWWPYVSAILLPHFDIQVYGGR